MDNPKQLPAIRFSSTDLQPVTFQLSITEMNGKAVLLRKSTPVQLLRLRPGEAEFAAHLLFPALKKFSIRLELQDGEERIAFTAYNVRRISHSYPWRYAASHHLGETGCSILHGMINSRLEQADTMMARALLQYKRNSTQGKHFE